MRTYLYNENEWRKAMGKYWEKTDGPPLVYFKAWLDKRTWEEADKWETEATIDAPAVGATIQK